MRKHLMIDLETLGTAADSRILSMGAVMFTDEGSFLKTLYVDFDLDSQRDRTITDSTIRWWLGQGTAAAHLAKVERGTDFRLGLAKLDNLIDDKDIKVWSNGASFDIPMLEHAYSSIRMITPWNHWNTRCYRTVKSLHRNVPAPEFKGVKHNALDDAKNQAHHLIAIHRTVGDIL